MESEYLSCEKYEMKITFNFLKILFRLLAHIDELTQGPSSETSKTAQETPTHTEASNKSEEEVPLAKSIKCNE